FEAVLAQSLKGIRGSAGLVGATAKETRARLGDAFSDDKSLLARFNGARSGHDGQLPPAEAAVTPGKAHHAAFFLALAAYQLVRLADLNHFLHAGHFFQRARFHGPFVAGYSDSCALRSRDRVGTVSQ